MPDSPLSDAATIVAYQDVTLAELQGLFDQLDFDLTDILEREARIGDALDAVDSEFEKARASLAEMGIAVPVPARRADDVPTAGEDEARPLRYDVPVVPAEVDFDTLVTVAEAHLKELGIDLTRDPLQQVLPTSEITRSIRAYADEHGDIEWEPADWAVVIGAGLLATILDIVLVRTPRAVELRNGKKYTGSPLTEWLNKNSDDIHRKFFKGLEKDAKVPFDARYGKDTGGLVSHMSPRNHRPRSVGHDPSPVGLIRGVRDLMCGTGTYVENGKYVTVPTDYDPVSLNVALLKWVRHLLSDVATPAGLPAPFFTLLQLGDIESPFTRMVQGRMAKASWAEIADYMYQKGYDLRHFFTMGITPCAVEATIRLYWHLKSYASDGAKEQRKQEDAKLASMLLLGHTIATSGTLIKTGVIYAWNPLAFNYAQLQAMAPVTVAWFKEAVARDRRISHAFEREWQSLVAESRGEPGAVDSRPPHAAPPDHGAAEPLAGCDRAASAAE